eukprot:3093829-Pyramimonas_sp.AAC.2
MTVLRTTSEEHTGRPRSACHWSAPWGTWGCLLKLVDVSPSTLEEPLLVGLYRDAALLDGV